MNKWVTCLAIILFTISGCTTHYQVARKHFERGNLAYKNGRLGRALKEYDRTLRTSREAPVQPVHQFLQAVVYHQIYLMEPLVLWQKLSQSARKKCLYLSKIIPSESSLNTPDFLLLAFQEIIKAEKTLKESDLPEQEKWLLIAKDIIIGDLLTREVNTNSPSGIKNKIREAIPESFIDKIRRYAFYESAKLFYLDAWTKNISFIYTHPSVDITWLTELSQKRLKGICQSLSSINSALSYLDRNAEFQDIFRTKSRQYLEVMKQIEMTSLPLSPDLISSEEKIGELIGLIQEPEYLVMDGSYHLKEIRVKVSTALEEVLAQKNALPHFLDALKHLALIQVLGDLNNPSEKQLADSLAEDIYLNLYRILVVSETNLSE